MKLDTVKVDDVLEMMTIFQPDWMIRWAGQNDLQNVIGAEEGYGRGLLTREGRSKVEAVLRAAYAGMKAAEKEATENSAKLAEDAGL